MNCCGDHVVNMPRPDDLIFSVCCSDNLARGDAHVRICLNSEHESMESSCTYKWCILSNEGINQLVNIFRSCGPVDGSKGDLMGNWSELTRTLTREKKSILQKILIVFHAVLAFPRETFRYQHLRLLRCSGSRCHNQEGEEVQEHEFPSECQITTVSLRPRTRIHNCKR